MYMILDYKFQVTIISKVIYTNCMHYLAKSFDKVKIWN